MKTIIAVLFLLPALSFASGSQKGMKCSTDGELVLKIKPRIQEDTHVEFFSAGELTDLQVCELFLTSRTYTVTCTVSEDIGYTTVTKIVAKKNKKNGSTFTKTYITPQGEEVLEDFDMTCRKL